jgi:protein-ribulosamine 3-kinase
VILPADVLADLRTRFGEIGAVQPLGGGCIGQAFRVQIGGESRFLKCDRESPDGFFAVEARGLERLRGFARALRVPRVVGYRDRVDGWGWIALEWLPAAPPGPGYWEALGEGLAALHRSAGVGAGWGAEESGFIGRLPQCNEPAATWAEFWYERRLLPQLRLVRAGMEIGSAAEWDGLRYHLPALLQVAETEGPSLLHGDLWSGNVVATAEGPALIDPASYRGHREVDLAMAALFGGFEATFFDAYAAAWPMAAGESVRRGVYQLYYLLVHVNIFGAAYAPQTARTLRQVLASCG